MIFFPLEYQCSTPHFCACSMDRRGASFCYYPGTTTNRSGAFVISKRNVGAGTGARSLAHSNQPTRKKKTHAKKEGKKNGARNSHALIPPLYSPHKNTICPFCRSMLCDESDVVDKGNHHSTKGKKKGKKTEKDSEHTQPPPSSSFSPPHQIVANGRLVAPQFFLRVPVSVDDLHLLHQRTLARLTRSCERRKGMRRREDKKERGKEEEEKKNLKKFERFKIPRWWRERRPFLFPSHPTTGASRSCRAPTAPVRAGGQCPHCGQRPPAGPGSCRSP